ncbi:hypothetical protein SAMN02910447_01441 [Ruminococcus sp. YE71]|uniref:immunity protein Imm33 domain-containing protein n=1 Tax=unclassified Ruminococcus TaxID=2608920 RepID=UPI00088995AB|nr:MULTISPECIES: DUF2185 domain-containing protein [unclassified Ruminococcus]SDA18925.1 hypothetical protein SAMN02910446_01533 [Ruminococcus sp. YE78]SFW28974.1 hypothetical protein SAMN02910447_01441 [Ruminococcus sp. YE71]
MTDKEKKALLEKAEELRRQGDLHEVVRLLFSEQRDPKADPDIMLPLVRAMLDISESSQGNDLSETAEIFLNALDNMDSSAEWHLLAARADYLRNRYYAAYAELLKAEELNKSSDRPVSEEELSELLAVCRQELKSMNARYAPNDHRIVLSHIGTYFGKITGVIRGRDLTGITPHRPELDVFPDIAVIDPDDEHEWRTFVTVGSGATEMNVPDELRPYNCTRCEYVMYLPASWTPAESAWAINLMKNISAIPKERNSYAGFGHIFSSGSNITEDTDLFGTMLIDVQEAPQGAEQLELSDGSRVVFYQLFPVYREEFEFKLSHGYSALISLMPHISAVFDLHRENVCKNTDDEHPVDELLLAPEFDYTGKLGVGEFCAVSRRIVEQGERVGFMRRFLPESGQPAAETDSGWLFLSGAESMSSLAMPYTLEICRLNTVCNIDPDVVPFLTSPYESTFFRGEDDRFIPLLPDPDETRPPMS